MIRLTSSLCPECYGVIPATIHESNGSMWMEKKCPVHGEFIGMVEREAFWFWLCHKLNCRDIYPAYLMDVTDKCNISCKYCYHENGSRDQDVDAIVKDAEAHKHLAPFGLIGGEPTVHPYLPEIFGKLIKIAKTTIVTNGIKMCNEEYFNSLCEVGLVGPNNHLNLALSFHKESKGKDIEFLEFCRSLKLVIPETFWVIDELPQIDDAVKVYDRFRDVIGGMRFKAASNLGAETKAGNKIYVSDMLAYLQARGRTDIVTNGWGNKVSFANVLWEGMNLYPCSWYNITNIDLNDVNCGPFYKALDGSVHNLVTAILVSDGIRKRQHTQGN